METKKISGFHFVKIGEAYLADEPLKATFNKKPLKDWRLKLRLVVDEKILDAEQSAYVVMNESEIIYIGYFSNSFRQRWWRKKGYFWHGDILDNTVDKLVRNGKNITVWLTIDPYVEGYNISKLIEDQLIIEYADKGIINTVGKNLLHDKSQTMPVKSILGID